MSRSVMQHSFARVPTVNTKRSMFDRSHGYKTTFDAGYLVPIFWDEVLPGDTCHLNLTALARLTTPIFPIMDNLFLETFFFAVPKRLIWQNWQRFCGERRDPEDSIDYLVPQISFDSPSAQPVQEGSIYDYFGLPLGLSTPVNAFFMRAYNLVYNEWFRDQNLQNSIAVPVGDGPDDHTTYSLLRRGKRHDYFTSCLPWPQKGDSVDLPLGTTAPVVGNGAPTFFGSPGAWQDVGPLRGEEITGNVVTSTIPANSAQLEWNSTALTADLSQATAATVNQVRQAFQIQRLLERDARSGTRYVEILKSHFGVTSPDQRLQRPEYLGGGSTPVNISPIVQMSSSDGTSPQGNLAATGTAGLSRHGFSKSFTEHCVVIGLANLRADLTYQQGVERHWSRRTRYDFYWPALAHLGEQAVLNKEIYVQNNASDDAVFGYQERFAEYRYKQSLITGKFRSGAADSLDAWHLSQQFGALPTLASTFIQDAPPMDRVLAVPTQPDVFFDGYYFYKHARAMPVYGIPGFIDRF